MKRDELNFALEQNSYLKGGTKEACLKVRQFIQNSIYVGNRVYSTTSCVSADEFIRAVEVLMAHSYQQEDTVPDRWHCDEDCQKASCLICPGEFNLYAKTTKLCPFFIDEANK
ncbi:MAG: hypothetical protein IKV94_02175 [Clostridia bacterium]|nr:hypothetical protein [Clostridia bacterium]